MGILEKKTQKKTRKPLEIERNRLKFGIICIISDHSTTFFKISKTSKFLENVDNKKSNFPKFGKVADFAIFVQKVLIS